MQTITIVKSEDILIPVHVNAYRLPIPETFDELKQFCKTNSKFGFKETEKHDNIMLYGLSSVITFSMCKENKDITMLSNGIKVAQNLKPNNVWLIIQGFVRKQL